MNNKNLPRYESKHENKKKDFRKRLKLPTSDNLSISIKSFRRGPVSRNSYGNNLKEKTSISNRFPIKTQRGKRIKTIGMEPRKNSEPNFRQNSITS